MNTNPNLIRQKTESPRYEQEYNINRQNEINEQIDDEPTEKEEPDTPNSEIDYEKNNSLSSEEDDYIEDDNEINSFEDDD